MYSAFSGANTNKQPDKSAALGLLQHLEKQQLQELLDDETKLDQIILDLSQVISMLNCSLKIFEYIFVV